MSTGGARRGRRDNGLDAADFAAAGDVDPRVGEHLLDLLAIEGIAAYLQPSADLNPILRATTLPGRPTDRLYVDRTHLDDARAAIDRLTDGVALTAPPSAESPTPDDSQDAIDAEWAKIIAGFHTPTDPTTQTPWPAAEGADPTRATSSTDPTRPPSGAEPVPPDFSDIQRYLRRHDREPATDESADLADDPDDEDRYVPPPPPPLPRVSKYTVAGALGIIVGFFLIMKPDLLPVPTGAMTLLGFGAVIGGAITLVWRLRAGDDDEDDFDDGAVV